MGVKHLQVRLTSEEYDQFNQIAGEGAMQAHLRGLILREIAKGKSGLSKLDALPKKDRAIAEMLLDFLSAEPPERTDRRKVLEGVLTIFRGNQNT